MSSLLAFPCLDIYLINWPSISIFVWWPQKEKYPAQVWVWKRLHFKWEPIITHSVLTSQMTAQAELQKELKPVFSNGPSHQGVGQASLKVAVGMVLFSGKASVWFNSLRPTDFKNTSDFPPSHIVILFHLNSKFSISILSKLESLPSK